ncbi:MAG: ankyrin repeat domain-containing protein [Candidatus Sericytochromatia bacterium]
MDINNKDKLLNEARNNNIEYIKEYLSQGGDINITFEEFGSQSLYDISLINEELFNSFELRDLLIKEGFNLSKVHDGYSLLDHSIRSEHKDLVFNGTDRYICYYDYSETKFLIDNGIDINVRNRDGETALFSAIQYAHCNVIKLLLDLGVDLFAINNQGISAFDYAFNFKNKESRVLDIYYSRIIYEVLSVIDEYLSNKEFLLNNDSKMLDDEFGEVINLEIKTNSENKYKLVKACKNNDIDYIKGYLSEGGDINSIIIDIHCHTLLSLAFINNNLVLMRFLLENGANVNSTNCYNETLLFRAVENNNYEVVQLLLDFNADFLIKNDKGYSAIQYALYLFNDDIKKLLVDKLYSKMRKSSDELIFIRHKNIFLFDEMCKLSLDIRSRMDNI